MKKNSIILVMGLASIIGLSSCASKKTVAVTEQKLMGSTEILLPFSGKEFKSDEKFFREKGKGISPDMATAKKIAMTNALTELSSRVQTTLKAVRDNYTNQRTVGDKQEFANKFEEMARLVVNQELNNIDVLDEKAFKEQDGRTSYWVVLEMSKDKVLNGMNDKISKDAKLQLDFDKFQFEKVFNEEMKKFEGQ